ncbi:MAG: hypothetical protein PUB20_06285 [Clostridia bacterium]|nr:hypothetical protein [Clostridia bacterium]
MNEKNVIGTDGESYWLFSLGDREKMLEVLDEYSRNPKYPFDKYMSERREKIPSLTNEDLQTLFAIRFVNERLLNEYPFSVEEILNADDEKLFGCEKLYELKNVYMLEQRLLDD